MRNLQVLSLAGLSKVWLLVLTMSAVASGCKKEAPPASDVVVAVPNENDRSTVSFGPKSAFGEQELKRAIPGGYPTTSNKTSPREVESGRYCAKATCSECVRSGDNWVCSGCKCN